MRCESRGWLPFAARNENGSFWIGGLWLEDYVKLLPRVVFQAIWSSNWLGIGGKLSVAKRNQSF